MWRVYTIKPPAIYSILPCTCTVCHTNRALMEQVWAHGIRISRRSLRYASPASSNIPPIPGSEEHAFSGTDRAFILDSGFGSLWHQGNTNRTRRPASKKCNDRGMILWPPGHHACSYPNVSTLERKLETRLSKTTVHARHRFNIRVHHYDTAHSSKPEQKS